MTFQTDFEELYPWISKEGCLFFSILKGIEDFLVTEIDDEMVLHIAQLCLKNGIMTAEKDKKKEGCYVWDHAALGDTIFDFLKSPFQMAYQAARYTRDMAYKTDWGAILNPDLLIFQFRTQHLNSHFRLLDYDPYRPNPKLDRLLSIRYYSFERR